MKLALVLALVTALQVDPEKRLDDIVRRLGSNEITERSKAEEELRKITKEAPEKMLEPLKARLKQAQDPEVKMRLQAVIGPIEWLNLWTTKPSELADVYVKKTACPECKRPVPWSVSELKSDLLAKYVSDCKFFLLAWKCCQEQPVLPKVLSVVKQPDTYFEIGNGREWKSNLATYLKPVADQEEALRVGAIVAGLWWSFGASFDEKVGQLVKEGHVTKTDNKWFTVDYPNGNPKDKWEVWFDLDGRLSTASYHSGMRVTQLK